MITPYYQDGNCTLYHGDCREILPSIGFRCLVVTDPPYNVRDDKWDLFDSRNYYSFMATWLTQSIKLSRRVITFFAQAEFNLISTLCSSMFPRTRLCIWDKPIGSQYAGAAEDGVWYAMEPFFICDAEPSGDTSKVAAMIRNAREAAKLSRGAVDIAIRGRRTGLCYRWEEGSSVPSLEDVAKLSRLLNINGNLAVAIEECGRHESPRYRDVFSHRTVTSGLHPCEKPLPLMSDIVDAFTTEEDIVLDPFCGSGTTLLAARNLGRSAIGIEINQAFCEIAAERLRQQILFSPALIQSNAPSNSAGLFD